jgi:hypothetical protein
MDMNYDDDDERNLQENGGERDEEEEFNERLRREYNSSEGGDDQVPPPHDDGEEYEYDDDDDEEEVRAQQTDKNILSVLKVLSLYPHILSLSSSYHLPIIYLSCIDRNLKKSVKSVVISFHIKKILVNYLNNYYSN